MNWLIAINILLLIIVSNAFIAGCLFIKAIMRNFRDYISSPGDEQPSPLSLTWERLSAVLAQQIAVQVKTTIMGFMSGASRGEAAEQADLAEINMAIENPAVAGLLEMLPKSLKKKVRQNPLIAKMIIDKVTGGITKTPSNGHNISNDSGPRFNL
jgi:hypothetical protein